MFSYIPANQVHGAPLIVVLHSCKQKAASFASDAGWFALSDRYGLALLLPEQKSLPSYLYRRLFLSLGHGPVGGQQSERLLQLVPIRRHSARSRGGGACRSGR